MGKLFTVVQPLSPEDMVKLGSDTNMHVNESVYKTDIRTVNEGRYPHLEKSNPLLDMTEEQVIDKTIDLENSVLDDRERIKVRELIKRHRDAFSLYGELGTCPKFEVDFELNDPTPFFIRPYTVQEADKKVITSELDKLVT